MLDATKTSIGVGTGTRIILAIIIVALLATVQFLRPPSPDLWWQSLFQALHAPLFGLIAIFVLLMTPSDWPWRRRIAATAGGVLALSLISEAAQIPMPGRSASLSDLVNDWAGAAAFLSAGILLLPNSPVKPGRGRYLLLFALLLMILPARPFASVSAAYWQRYQQLPSIAPFNARASRMFYALENAIVVIEDAGPDSILTEFRFGKRGASAVDFHDPWSDWSGYDHLVIDLENLNSDELRLTIRIHDELHLRGDQPYEDRFNRRLEFEVGREPIRIAVADIESAPAERRLDIQHIDGVVIFGTENQAGSRFIIHDIRLE